MQILVLNSGSSSQKSALFQFRAEPADTPAPPAWQGKLDWDGNQETMAVQGGEGRRTLEKREVPPEERNDSLRRMLGLLWTGETAVIRGPDEISIVGHRIVHGGSRLAEPVVVNEQVKTAIRAVSEIAPLHNQAGLAGITLAEELFPNRQQVAVFDTGFHRTLPMAAAVYPGPYEWYERGIRRYGFHGINHQYLAGRAARLVGRSLASLKTVTCHLGNGCSVAAIAGGKSIDTSMGFTPLEGLMMGTRSGSIDPGILIHLLRSDHLTADGADQVLNHQSGLMGISGISSDLRDLLGAIDDDKGQKERAQLALDMFIYRLRLAVGAMAAALRGLEVLVFSGGIGENSPEVRRGACQPLEFLGVELEESQNAEAKPDLEISSAQSRVRVLVIRAQEEWAIARECARIHRERSRQ